MCIYVQLGPLATSILQFKFRETPPPPPVQVYAYIFAPYSVCQSAPPPSASKKFTTSLRALNSTATKHNAHPLPGLRLRRSLSSSLLSMLNDLAITYSSRPGSTLEIISFFQQEQTCVCTTRTACQCLRTLKEARALQFKI